MVVGTWVCFKSPYKCLPSKIDFRVKKGLFTGKGGKRRKSDLKRRKKEDIAEKGGKRSNLIPCDFFYILCFSLQNSPKMTKKKSEKFLVNCFEKLKSQKPTTPGIPRRFRLT